jgi:hypothetical protein
MSNARHIGVAVARHSGGFPCDIAADCGCFHGMTATDRCVDNCRTVSRFRRPVLRILHARPTGAELTLLGSNT